MSARAPSSESERALYAPASVSSRSTCGSRATRAEDRATHFETIAYGQGATMALPIWGLFMKKCYENESLGISQEDFLAPEKLNIPIDCEAIKPIPSINDDAEDIKGLGL